MSSTMQIISIQYLFNMDMIYLKTTQDYLGYEIYFGRNWIRRQILGVSLDPGVKSWFVICGRHAVSSALKCEATYHCEGIILVVI